MAALVVACMMHSSRLVLVATMMQEMKFLMQTKLELVGVISLLKRLRLAGEEVEGRQAHHLAQEPPGHPHLPSAAQEDHHNQDISSIMVMKMKIQMMRTMMRFRQVVEVVREAGDEVEVLPQLPGVAEVAPGRVANQQSESEHLQEQLLVMARGMTLAAVHLVDAVAVAVALGSLALASNVSSKVTCHRHAQTASAWTHVGTYMLADISCEIMNVSECNTSVYLFSGRAWLVFCRSRGQRRKQTTRAWPPA